MKIPGLFGIIVLAFSSCCLNAQDFPYHYFSNINPMVNNPAFTASESDIRADAGMYSLWAGGYKPLNDYMTSFSISPELNFKKQKRRNGYNPKIGLGFVFLRERFGAFSQNNFQFDYSYHIPIAKHAYMSLGIALMVENLSIDINSLSANNQEDPRLLTGNNSSVLFDGGFGTAIRGKNYVLSFSVINLASDDFKFDVAAAEPINNYSKFCFTGEYNFELSPNIYLQPKLTIRNSRSEKYNSDTSLAVEFYSFRVGFGYRTENSIYFFTKIPYKDFFFSYCSENPVQANRLLGYGHIFTVGWSFSSPHL